MPHQLLTLLNITVPPGVNEADIIKKICNDNLVTLRAQERMVMAYVTDVVRDMNLLEKSALVKKVCPPPAVSPSVKWTVQMSQSGMLVVRASVNSEFLVFAGAPKNVAKSRFHGELVPQAIVDEYTERYKKMFWIDTDGFAHDHNPINYN